MVIWVCPSACTHTHADALSNKHTQRDVVIVGAGPAGLAAAIRIKKRAEETGQCSGLIQRGYESANQYYGVFPLWQGKTLVLQSLRREERWEPTRCRAL